MGRPKELTTCALCGDDTPAITRIEYEGQWVPVCNMHRSRIYRYGKGEPVRRFWVKESNMKKLVGMIVGEGMSYYKACDAFGPSNGKHGTRIMRFWRRTLLAQHEDEGETQQDLADRWGLSKAKIRENIALAREEREKGLK